MNPFLNLNLILSRNSDYHDHPYCGLHNRYHCFEYWPVNLFSLENHGIEAIGNLPSCALISGQCLHVIATRQQGVPSSSRTSSDVPRSGTWTPNFGVSTKFPPSLCCWQDEGWILRWILEYRYKVSSYKEEQWWLAWLCSSSERHFFCQHVLAFYSACWAWFISSWVKNWGWPHSRSCSIR